jgi:cytochrome c-type biogenesis protein CcmH
VCCLFLIISQKNLLADTSNSNKNFIINKTREISQNIKCLVCQNQSIDESNSEIAKDLKVLIKDKLKDGVTDEEIYKFLRDRYGDTILLKPPLETNTILLWFLPFIILVFGSFFVIRFFKSNYK